ncbi:MAG: GGDEF domain-containing protein [Acidobacteriaceae bacterium]|nr:GGDEF domain-containing protein [Acidobacteriaceae bacterium]
MISIKRYLDQAPDSSSGVGAPDAGVDVAVLNHAYQAALSEMGQAGVQVCPPVGEALQRSLGEAADRLHLAKNKASVAEVQTAVHASLEDWTRQATAHYGAKAQEVKDLLLTLTHIAQSVGERDTQCAEQMTAVTERLERIANLEDVTEIRSSIVESAAELKASVDRMTEAGKDAMEALQAEVTTYRSRLEEAEQLALRDTLTSLATRLATEEQIRRRIEGKAAFSVALLDINDFKGVNDQFGHMAGDELLRQFATELRGACRQGDVVGRWGGDEFVVLLDCRLQEAMSRAQRIQQWVCGSYTLHVREASQTVAASVAIGVAEWQPDEGIEQLLDRADAAMYSEKSRCHAGSSGDRPSAVKE